SGWPGTTHLPQTATLPRLRLQVATLCRSGGVRGNRMIFGGLIRNVRSFRRFGTQRRLRRWALAQARQSSTSFKPTALAKRPSVVIYRADLTIHRVNIARAVGIETFTRVVGA